MRAQKNAAEQATPAPPQTFSPSGMLWNCISEPIGGPRWRRKKKKRKKLRKWQKLAPRAYVYRRSPFYFTRGGSRWNTPIPRLCNRKHREKRRRSVRGRRVLGQSHRVRGQLTRGGLSEQVDGGWSVSSSSLFLSLSHATGNSARALDSAGRTISHSMVNQIPVPQAKYELLTNIRQWVSKLLYSLNL